MRKLLIAAAAATSLAPALAPALASAAGPHAMHARPVTGPPFERNVSDYHGVFEAGEPEVAVNPKDPRNIVVAFPNYKSSNELTAAAVSVLQPGGAKNVVATTHDGGRTWHKQELDTHDPLFPSGGDSFVTAGPDGSFYAGGEVFAPSFEVVHNAVWRSTDGGDHWTGPTYSMGTDSLVNLASRGIVAPPGGATPTDRPWIVADRTTGTVYQSGRDMVTNEGFIATSHDRGKTWSELQPFDSPGYKGNYGTIDAARGILAAAYVASAYDNSSCNCLVFETSRDGGLHWTHHRVPVDSATLNGTTGFLDQRVAADPTRSGRFALMVADGDAYDIWLTENGGHTWQRTARLHEQVSHAHSKPWFAYGYDGSLAAMWRADNGNKLDVYVAASRDGGHTWHGPVRANEGEGPYTDTLQPIGDDTSAVAVEAGRVDVVWGDRRPGLTSVYFASVPLP